MSIPIDFPSTKNSTWDTVASLLTTDAVIFAISPVSKVALSVGEVILTLFASYFKLAIVFSPLIWLETTYFWETPGVGVPIWILNSKLKIPSVVNWPINTLFAAVGPVAPFNAEIAPSVVMKEFPTWLAPSKTLKSKPGGKAKVTASGLPSMLPSCVFNPIPIAAAVLFKIEDNVNKLAAPLSSVFKTPIWPPAEAPTENQESSATVLSFNFVLLISFALKAPSPSLLKKEVVVAIFNGWSEFPYKAWKRYPGNISAYTRYVTEPTGNVPANASADATESSFVET